jgi:hypothetical protein
MLLFRLILTIMLLAGVVCFAAFALTGKPVWRARGMKIVKAVLLTVLVFAVVLLLERVLMRL